MYIPSNTTLVLQPIDQGVIWSFKCIYRKLFVEYILNVFDNKIDFCIAKNLDMFQSMWLVKQAWREVHPDIIINSFRKAGFSEEQQIDIPEDPTPCIIEDFNEFVSIDDRLLSKELEITYTDDEVCLHSINNL